MVFLSTSGCRMTLEEIASTFSALFLDGFLPQAKSQFGKNGNDSSNDDVLQCVCNAAFFPAIRPKTNALPMAEPE